ncbi:MAG: hypothetical protein LBM39_00010 [Candidatus Methanoplasma sp.]|jgi:hypothetical protein|nr:hypothetical protein [Candidatus Methanoplasma sp.]
MTEGPRTEGKWTIVPGDMTVSIYAYDDSVCLDLGYEISCTGSCSDVTGKPGRALQTHRPRDIDEEDRIICMRLGRAYTEDVPFRASFFEKLDFFLISDDRNYAKYLSILWPKTKITYDKLAACYIIGLDSRKNRLEEQIYCTIEEMVSARFSGEIVLG